MYRIFFPSLVYAAGEAVGTVEVLSDSYAESLPRRRRRRRRTTEGRTDGRSGSGRGRRRRKRPILGSGRPIREPLTFSLSSSLGLGGRDEGGVEEVQGERPASPVSRLLSASSLPSSAFLFHPSLLPPLRPPVLNSRRAGGLPGPRILWSSWVSGCPQIGLVENLDEDWGPSFLRFQCNQRYRQYSTGRRPH